MEKTKQQEYYFQYYGWIPGYNDFDMDDFTVKATSVEDAWKQFNKLTRYVKSAGLVSIDGIKYEEPVKQTA
jgi:hypothetical protein